MNPSETTYLVKYRDLSAKRKRIDELIGALRKVCESLSNWRDTASGLSSGASGTWSDGNLKEIMTLRTELITYHSLAVEVNNLWNNMRPEEKDGFASPQSLEK